MRKLLTRLAIGLLGLGALTLSGCAGKHKADDYQKSVLERLPFVYQMNVQQGNIVTAEQVGQLQPGMNKRQVRYLLGTPLLTDFFNADRWDYVYTMRRPHKPEEQRKLTVFFQDDAMVRFEGDVPAKPQLPGADKAKETLVTVPDYQESGGWITRGLRAVGIKKAD